MNIKRKKINLFDNVQTLKGVGIKLSKYLKNKKIEKINDLLWNFPYSLTDRRESVQLDRLEIGKIQTVKVLVDKYNFPRIRNLPFKISCKDDKGKIDLVYFNSREGSIRKLLPIKEWVIVSGKINFFKGKYQITNPDYVTTVDNKDYVQKIIPKYSLTEGLTEKSYRKIIEQVLLDLPKLDEWHEMEFLKKMNFLDWNYSIKKMHYEMERIDFNSNYYRRLVYDEIFSHLIVLSNIREKLKKFKKEPKLFKGLKSKEIIKSLPFNLTDSQNKVLLEIEKDLQDVSRMFRIVQGDVGSGKTIVAFLAAANVVEAGYQCALMAPTEILARQHFTLAEKIFQSKNINIKFITGKTDYKEKKDILSQLKENKIDFIIGTHSLFQKKVEFKKLGLIIIDEQHKFGVKQRIELAKKGGDNCDVLLMSATPIPRTMIMTIYGDMDISKITEKPLRRKSIITLAKPEEKINEVWPFIKKQISNNNQIFWVCPLIEESKFFDYSSAVKRFEYINKKFPNRVALLHGLIEKDEKNIILNKFLNKEIDILVSTTVIEVGIDFPNANLIIIENANKFGLAQLHQLRGRVGRGEKQATCLLLYKGSLSKNAIKRLKILKSTDDGFLIAEEDMKLRGFGDIIGFQQSGIKFFKMADPVHHEDLFKIAEINIKALDLKKDYLNKYKNLLKIFDKAEIIF